MTLNRVPFYIFIALLMVLGVGTAWLRCITTGVPILPGKQQPVWSIEARIDFIANDEALTVALDLPDTIPGFKLIEEQATSPGYGFSLVKKEGDKWAEWTKRFASGRQTLYYNAQYVTTDDVRPRVEKTPPVISQVFWSEAETTAAQEILKHVWDITSSSASTAREIIKLINDPAPDQNTALLLAAVPDKPQLLVNLLNQSGIASRIVKGLQLEDARRRQALISMVETYTDKGWLLINPTTGEQGVPRNVLLWSRGAPALLDVVGGINSRISFSMIEQKVPALVLSKAQTNNNFFSYLGVYKLPIEEQGVFKMLFLLPLGALVVVFMQLVVGLRTAGTFMPILISLAFLQTSLLMGLISFVSIVSFGLLLRSYLSHLNLLLVARISTLMVLVIFLISLLSLLGYQFGINTGVTATFFPMIIIAWTIERMSILWEEEGSKEVLIQGGGSLLVSVVAYLLMRMEIVNHLTFNFPELNLITLALILIMGQYTGYKILELYRFRQMGSNE